MTTMSEAAVARAASVRAAADRPAQRRSAEGALSFRAAFPARVELRKASEDADAGLQFAGVASVTEHAYEMWDMFGPYSEIVSAGAFADSLARADLDVPLVLGHDQLRRIARTTTGTLALSESDEGLDVRADLDAEDVDVAYIVPKLRAGLIDEMSFAFRITSGQWSPDYSEFRINGAEIHRGDVAIVGFGANPATFGGVGSRDSSAAAPAAAALRDRRESQLAMAQV